MVRVDGSAALHSIGRSTTARLADKGAMQALTRELRHFKGGETVVRDGGFESSGP